MYTKKQKQAYYKPLLILISEFFRFSRPYSSPTLFLNTLGDTPNLFLKTVEK